jgi:uncharacterized protein (TIGR02246 family)
LAGLAAFRGLLTNIFLERKIMLFGTWIKIGKVLCVAAVCAIAASSMKAHAQGKLEAEVALTEWAEALNAGNVEKTVAMYTSDAVLLGTNSPIISYSEEGVNKYFTGVAARLKIQVQFGEMSGRKLSDNAASFIGLYDFTVTPKDGATNVVPARFAIVVVKVDGKWKIAQHHSSPRPKPAQ